MNARFFSPTAKRRGASVLLTLVMAVYGLAFSAGCVKQTDEAAATRKVLRISQRNEPSDLDSATANLPDEFFIVRALSEGLLGPAPTANREATSSAGVVPAAAERWELSADGLTYTFYLRTDAYWSNGDAVTTQDFLYSYRRLLTPSTGAPKAAMFFMVKNARAFALGQLADFSQVGFHAPDAHTFTITLEHAMPQFLLYVASGPWIPVNRRSVETHGRNWTRPGSFVGNGPFILTEWRPNQRITVVRNARYHNASAAKVDEIRFIGIDSADTEERAFRSGQLDVSMTIPFAKLDRYIRDRPTEIHRAPLAETRFISFNTQRAPLNDRRVRGALSLAIDRTLITEQLLHGGHVPTERMLPPPLRGENDVASLSAEPVDEKLSRARRLLEEAGFPAGRGFPQLELTTWVNSPITEALQQMWKRELGVDVRLAVREAKVHVAALREGSYDIAFITAIPDVADAANLLEEFMTGAPGNYPHWSDPQFDEWMEQAKKVSEPSQRADILRRAESRLADESPVAPLYFNAKNWLMSSRVRGWRTDALWTRFYLNVEVIDQE